MTTTETGQAVRVGDFFEESWGYDQTNADFYQVVKISATGKTIWLRHVQASMVGNRVAPLPDGFHDRNGEYDDGIRNGEPFRRKLSGGWRGAPWINLTTYSGAGLWDCQPAYDTIAAGEQGH